MSRAALRIANVALFVLSCFLVANVINQLSSAALAPTHAAALPLSAAVDPTQRDWTARKAILDRNLFGAQVVSKQVEVVAAPPDEELKKTKLPLKLLGTIASSDDSSVSSAAIEDTSTRKHEVVKIGDHLKKHTDVQVVGIERKRVILQNGAQREELVLSETASPQVSAAASKPSGRSKRASRRRASRRSRTETPPEGDENSLEKRLKSLADEGGGRNAAAIFTGGKALPKYENGEMVGLEISEVKNSGFYDKLGLGDGDVVTEINGMKVDNPSATQELFRIFRDEENIQAQVMASDGSSREIKLPREELMKIFMSGSE